jgi:hypothetical protein
MRCEETIRTEPEAALLDLINAQRCEGKLAIFEPLDPALFFQIPNVEFDKVDRNSHETGNFHLSKAGIVHLASTLHVIEG